MRRGLLLDEFDTIRDGRLGIFSLLRCAFPLNSRFDVSCRVRCGEFWRASERSPGEWTELGGEYDNRVALAAYVRIKKMK